MNSPPRPCVACRAAVSDDALESGTAILLLGKAYCPDCKGSAMKDVSLEDLADPAPARRALPPPPPPVKPAAPAPPPRERPATRAIPVRAARRPSASRLPLLLGVAAAAALVVVLALALRGGNKSPTSPSGTTTSKADPAPAPADPESRAREAYRKIEPLLRRGDSDPDQVLASIESARRDCAGTSYAAKLDVARDRIVADREKAEASRKLDPLLDALKKGVAADKDFTRYDELQALFQEGRALVARASPSAVATFQTLQQDYANRYERAAEPFYKDILEAAEPLSQEGRHDDALRRIDSFPKHLRKSGAWRGLEALRARIEQDKRLSPKKK